MSDLIDRQTAIEALNKLSESTYEVDYGVIDCDDAIRAIEQLPLAQPAKVATDINVGDKDTISRKAAIEEIERWLGYIDDDMVRRMQIGMKRLPPAQPERIKGHWVDDCTYMGIQCSVCGKSLQDYIHATEYAELMEVPNFCPNCGAEMEVTT